MTKTHRIIVLAAAVCIVLASPASGPLQAQPAYRQSSPAGLQADFDEGNRLYGDGDFRGAIEAYSRVLAGGVVDKDLFYNLGNACYKNGELGRAVLYYERALKLAPRDRDIRENLAHVEFMLRDRQFIMNENRFKKTFMWINRNLNLGEAVLLTSVLYLLFCLLLLLFIFKRSAPVDRLYRPLSIASPGRFLGLSRTQDLLLAVLVAGCLLAGSGISTWRKLSNEKRQNRAVVIELEAAVFSGPAKDSTLQFKIHEGTRATVRSRSSGWVQIDLPGDLTGWVIHNTIEEI